MSFVSESILLGLGAATIVFCGIICGSEMGKGTIQDQAVKKGYADWVVDCAGKTQFKWKEAKP